MMGTSLRAEEVLVLERRPVSVDPLQQYQEIGVRSFGRGIFHKEPVQGADLGSKRVFWIEPGDLVFNNVFAWEGAVALAGPEERGKIGSHRFMTYVVDPGLADPRYLRFFFLSERGLTLLQRASPGSAGRNRTLAIERFAALTITLPALHEQRDIASNLEESLGRLSVLQEIGAESADSTRRVRSGLLGELFEDLDLDGGVPLGEVASVLRGRGPQYLLGSGTVAINQACIHWEGLNLRRAREVDGHWSQALPDEFRTSQGDVLVNSTGEGTLGRACVVSERDSGYPFDSHVLAVRLDRGRLLPRFLARYLRSPHGQLAIEMVKGAKTTKQTELGKRKLEEMRVPMPSVADQKRMLAHLDSGLALVRKLETVMAKRYEQMQALGASMINAAFDEF